MSAKLKATAKNLVAWAFPVMFPVGLAVYELTGKTPRPVYWGFRKYFCISNGYLNRGLSNLIKVIRGTCSFPNSNGVLGNLSPQDIKVITERIERDGFYVFENKLPTDTCERLLQFALSQKCSPRHDTQQGEATLIDRKHPTASLYYYSEETILQSPEVCQLVTDLSLLSVAQAYLGSKPICDLVNMWWSTAFSKTPSDGGAQLYHFDMDRIKFLKFFIYITDVSTDDGPHCFVRGSHKKRPRRLLKDRRLSDAEVGEFYEKDDFLEFCGPRGTIVAEDTSGFHKGKVPTSDRLLLQFEFTNSLFGVDFNWLAPSPFMDIQKLKEYRHSFRRFMRMPPNNGEMVRGE